ncbi:MAG TPA: amidohydrolase family protein [Candidatus Rubrimentiphilum sp.]|nr:amidohydrolase family protein [Candidatus Rubrimentiphilum sp.]
MALLVRAKAIVTCDTDAPQNGITFSQLGLIDNASLLIEDGRVAFIGHPEAQPRGPERMRGAVETLDFPDCIIVPGFVDAHAHPLFAGDREADFAARQGGEKPLLGMSYTVKRTREALNNPDEFWNTIANRLRLIAAHGTTTLETKTGYALTKAGEFQILDLIAAHKDDAGLPRLVGTFLGAHAVPPEYSDEKKYIDFLIAEVLPDAKDHGAVYADAFCEPGFFSPHHTQRYLEAARAYGLRLRVHCDEMGHAGAAEMAAGIGVDAVDHCNYITDDAINAVVAHDIVTVTCPATIEYLNLPRHAPVRKILERGGTVAFASDYNPGTSPCFNLQTVAYFARKLFRVTAAEALYGVTVAAAKSLRTDAGRLRAGALADFVALQIDSPEEFGWQFGGNLAAAVFKAGARVA